MLTTGYLYFPIPRYLIGDIMLTEENQKQRLYDTILFVWFSKTTNNRGIKLTNGCRGPGWGEKADGKETPGHHWG